MIRLIQSWYERKLAENKTSTAALTAESRIIEEASQLVTERPDQDGFVRVYGINDREKGHLETNQLDMIKQARKMERFDPHAHGILMTMVNYIMGRGLSITPKSEDPLIWYIWREFWTAKRNNMAIRQFEIVRRLFRDGEIFIEFFDKDDQGASTGKTTIRFIDPLLVRDDPKTTAGQPTTVARVGITTDPNDVEKTISYTVQDRNDENKFRIVPAENVLHVKINADSDQKRGESFLQCVMNYIRNYQQWLENRIILNKMRSAIVMIKKVEGTPTEVAKLANTIANATNTASGETKRQQIRGGTVITEGPGVTYRMEAPNINATDVKEDGRNIKIAMAAGLNLPEYVFGDASNANYASTLIAESPFVKAIEYWQIYIEQAFSEIYKRVLENAVNAGVIEAPNDDEFIAQLKQVRMLGEAEEVPPPAEGEEAPKPGEETEEPEDPKEAALKELMPNGKMEMPSEVFYGCDMMWPEIIHREFKTQVEGLVLAREAGWVSDPTACSAIGYDYSEEVRKQNQAEEDAEKNDNALLGKPGDDAEMGAEFDSVMKSLTPEERQKVMTGTPEEVSALVKQKSAAMKMAATNGEED
jgi:capsid protein